MGFLAITLLLRYFSQVYIRTLGWPFQCVQLQGTALAVLQSEGTFSYMKIAG